jgi:type II secretion system protein J
MNCRISSPRSLRDAFTLVEVLLALAICAVVLVAINAVFVTAVHLRDQTANAIERSRPAEYALDQIRRDLKSVVGPHGFLAGDFKCNAQAMGTSMGLATSGGNGLDFFCSSGIVDDTTTFGDIQEVLYQLMPPADRTQAQGQDLVRCVNRNLLATTTQTPELHVILSGIQTIDLECYDGTQWLNTWDTSLGDINTNLPVAVRIRIQPALDRNDITIKPPALETIVPLVTYTLYTNAAGQLQ